MKEILKSLDDPFYYVKLRYIVLWALILIWFFWLLFRIGAAVDCLTEKKILGERQQYSGNYTRVAINNI